MTTPLLSCANWGGQGIHPRGNFNGFVETPARQKWLEAQSDWHWSLFYSVDGLDLQKRFFDHFLKGLDNGWDRQPRVQLNIRYPGEKFVLRPENEEPRNSKHPFAAASPYPCPSPPARIARPPAAPLKRPGAAQDHQEGSPSGVPSTRRPSGRQPPTQQDAATEAADRRARDWRSWLVIC